MKITKILVLMSAAVFAAGLIGCGGGGKYSDFKPAVKKLNDATETFVAKMDKADSAEKVAAALTEYSKSMNEMKGKMEELMKKYPELEDMSDPPAELAEEAKQLEGLYMKMMPAMMKAQKYQDDPAVMKAMSELQGAMK